VVLPASFHPEAEVELVDALHWYEQAQTGLGFAFVSAVRDAVRFAAEFPDAGSALGDKLRRVVVPAFPYYVLYSHSADGLWILAIAHFRRRPG
jgi:hypothetical protein